MDAYNLSSIMASGYCDHGEEIVMSSPDLKGLLQWSRVLNLIIEIMATILNL